MSEKTPSNPSRTATERVKNPLPAPVECPHCRSSVSVVRNDEIYGKCYGDWPWAYLCDGCGAYVGMHPFTAIPLGTLANEEQRRARKTCKVDFEVLWKTGRITRDQAYAELADHMGIEKEACHFGWFDVDQCHAAQEWARGRAKELEAMKTLSPMVQCQCHCGKQYLARQADIDRGWGKSCSKRCAAKSREGNKR